jgi:hypothetical protein
MLAHGPWRKCIWDVLREARPRLREACPLLEEVLRRYTRCREAFLPGILRGGAGAVEEVEVCKRATVAVLASTSEGWDVGDNVVDLTWLEPAPLTRGRGVGGSVAYMEIHCV